MTTGLDLVTAAEQWLYSDTRPERNKLTNTIAASAATLEITYPQGGIQPGTTLCIDLEEFHVWDSIAGLVTVDGAQNGSTAAIHTAGAPIFVKPRFSRHRILKAINAAFDELSALGVFQVLTVDLTYDSAVRGYNFGSGTPLEVYEVRWKQTGSSLDWPKVDAFDYVPNLPSSDFASGKALFVDGATDGQAVRVKYFAPFTPLTTLAQDVLAIAGLPATAHDIPPYLAAANLVGPTEVRRNDPRPAGDTKRAEDVPVGAQQRSAAWLRAQAELRARQEADRLRALYPRRRR